MKYCLSIGLHNLYFDIAVVSEKHKIINFYRCIYDRSKDISSNIYNAYKKYFNKYSIVGIGVGVSNNINFKDDMLYSITAFNFNRYNLKQSLVKQFGIEVIIIEETYAASLGVYAKEKCESLLYVILDNKISNSFVVGGELLFLEEDIDLSRNLNLNEKCCKDTLKQQFLINGFDDEFIGGYFLSNDDRIQQIIKKWSKDLNVELEKIVKILKVNKIVFAGYIGEYFSYFKQYMHVDSLVECGSVDTHRVQTLVGISHLIFKDI